MPVSVLFTVLVHRCDTGILFRGWNRKFLAHSVSLRAHRNSEHAPAGARTDAGTVRLRGGLRGGFAAMRKPALIFLLFSMTDALGCLAFPFSVPYNEAVLSLFGKG
jgi:hypothetical protein